MEVLESDTDTVLRLTAEEVAIIVDKDDEFHLLMNKDSDALVSENALLLVALFARAGKDPEWGEEAVAWFKETGSL